MTNQLNVGMIGFGRFGRALGDLIANAGMSVRAFDPAADVPKAIRADSFEHAAADARMVIVAVPSARLREALIALRPHLNSSQTVLDVGSTKCAAVAALAQSLG